MSYRDKLLEILLKKLDSILNPKFQNRFILSLLFLGTSLLSYQKILSTLLQLEIITDSYIIKLVLSDTSNTISIYSGIFFVVISIILFILERFIYDTEIEHLQCNYYVCESYDQLVEISKGDLSKFPIENPLLIENEIMDSLNKIIKSHPNDYRHANAWGGSFSSEVEYIEKYPSSLRANKGDGKYSYFSITRTPDLEELKKIIHEDGILKLMIESKQPIEDIFCVGCYEDACGDIAVQEEYFFRKVWCAFLTIKNVTDKPLSLHYLHGEINRSKGFNPFISKNKDNKIINLPKAPLSANSTVIIPIAILLPPLYALDREEYSSIETNDWGERVQIVKHETIRADSLKDFLTFNGQILANSISYKQNGKDYSQNIHAFDLTNMYTIDRHWQCGSCPHLFLESDNLFYERELLAHCESRVGNDSFIVPKNVHTLFIAEIEDEITEIEIIKINGQHYKSNIILRNSDFIKIPVKVGDVIELIGKYIPNQPVNKDIPQGIIRNELIAGFINKRHLYEY